MVRPGASAQGGDAVTRRLDDARLTRFESFGSVGPESGQLAGMATFSDGRTIHVYGTVGTTSWQYIPKGARSIANGRKLSGVRVHVLNKALVPFIEYERELERRRSAATMASAIYGGRVSAVVADRKNAGERLLETVPALVKRLGEAAASATAAHHERLSDELVSIAETLAGFSYAAVARVEAMNEAEADFTAARAACDTLEPPPPEIPKEG